MLLLSLVGSVMCIRDRFGHTRPQWLLPYGGEVTLDPQAQTVIAHYRRVGADEQK